MSIKRPTRLYVNDHTYADPEMEFTVFDCFNSISRYIDRVGRKSYRFQSLAIASLDVFGWSDLELTQTLKNPDKSHEEVWTARQIGADGESVVSLLNYWGVRSSLLCLSLAWERPHILVGDTIINKVLREPDMEKYPLLGRKHYRPLRSQLLKQEQENLRLVQEIDKVLLSVYGEPNTPHITVGQLLEHTPSLGDDFFIPFDQM